MKLRAWSSLLILLGVVTLPSALPAQESTLSVLKLVGPIPDTRSFSFTLEGPSGDIPFSLSGGHFRDFHLEPGTYVVREDVPEDWDLLLIRCGSLTEVGPVASGALRFELKPGESVLCRFLNSNPSVPPVPPPGSTAVPALSPTALSLLMMALAVGGALILRRLE